jgi:small GTP-binding protein
MTTNASPEYLSAQKKYLLAQTDDEKLVALEEMLKYVPAHKGGEKLRADLRTRYKKLKEDMETKKKRKKSQNKAGIKKEAMQAVLIGLTGAGKSSLLSVLTNAVPIISSNAYTTKQPLLGTLDYGDVKIQIVDMPAVNFVSFDSGIANTADTLLIVIENPKQIEEIFPFLEKAYGNKVIVLNKIDLLNENEKRKYYSYLQSKKYNFIMFSCKTRENIEELKEKIWKSFNKIRVYTKEPGKKQDSQPVVMEENSSVREIAEKILHGFSRRIKESRVTGPSSKFPNQKVGLDHILKDKDIIEFHVK